MKPIGDLSESDLKACAVWRYQGDSDEVAQVTPTDRTALKEDDEVVYIAAPEFRLTDGTTCVGYCSPQDSSGLDYLQPVLILKGHHVLLWAEPAQDGDEIEALWKRFGRSLEQAFPISYRCLILVDGQEVSGVVEFQDISTRTG